MKRNTTLLNLLLSVMLAAALACAAFPRPIATPRPAAATARSANTANTAFPTGQQTQTRLPKGVEFVTSVEGLSEYRLANGLRIVLFPDQSKPTTTVNLTYLVGSRFESYGETGMAHLLEHMMFKGTPNHTNIPQELTEHGTRPNATTSFDRTNYFETFAATDANLEWAIKLEADRMINSFIAKKDLDSEMTVVRNEYEMGETSPFAVTLKRLHGAAYEWHSYAKDTIGDRSDIENVPIDRLQAFYHKYYQPDNAVLMVTGKFEPAHVLDLITGTFGAIPRPTRVLPPIYTIEPTQDGEHTVTIRRVGDTQVVMAAYHIPAGSSPDFAALEVLSEILSDRSSGRLYKALVETKKAASAAAFNRRLHDPGLLILFAQTGKDDSLDAVRDILTKTAEGFTADGPKPEEIARARTSLLKQSDIALSNSETLGLQMSEWMAVGDWRLFFLNRDQIRKVTAEDVRRVAQAYLKPSNRTIAMFVPVDKPDRAEIPPVGDVEAMLKDYKGGAAIAEGEAFDPSPANIDSRVKKADLPGGLKLALLPKKTRGGRVIATLQFRFGDLNSVMNRDTAASMAGEMLMRGTAHHTRQQIQDEFDRLKARVNIGGGATSANVSIDTNRKSLPAVLNLVAEILKEPAFPEKDFEEIKHQSLVSIESQRSQPNALAGNAFARHLGPFPKGDPRYVSSFDEDTEEIKAVTLEDTKKFYSDFYGASNGEISVIGDFDADALKNQLNELFGSWKSPRPYSRIVRDYKDISPLAQTIETPDKANAIFLAGELLNINDADPDYPALVLGNYMLGGGFLNSRLATRIRQKEGLSYGVSSFLAAGSLDKVGQFGAQAIYAPQNAAKLEAAFKEELARVLKDGFTAEEVATAKSGYLQQQQLNRSEDPALVRKLNSYLFLGRTLAWDADFDKKISALTPEQIAEAMRRWLDPAKLTIVKAGDFAGAAKQQPTAAPPAK
jgi:zinc protease